MSVLGIMRNCALHAGVLEEGSVRLTAVGLLVCSSITLGRLRLEGGESSMQVYSRPASTLASSFSIDQLTDSDHCTGQFVSDEFISNFWCSGPGLQYVFLGFTGVSPILDRVLN